MNAPLPEPEPTKGGDMTPTPDVSPVPPTAEPLWNLKQILDLIDYSTTSTVFEVATARDEVNQLRDLFQAHMPDGQPLLPTSPPNYRERKNRTASYRYG